MRPADPGAGRRSPTNRGGPPSRPAPGPEVALRVRLPALHRTRPPPSPAWSTFQPWAGSGARCARPDRPGKPLSSRLAGSSLAALRDDRPCISGPLFQIGTPESPITARNPPTLTLILHQSPNQIAWPGEKGQGRGFREPSSHENPGPSKNILVPPEGPPQNIFCLSLPARRKTR